MSLPDSPTLQRLWQRSLAMYERLRLQRLCQKVLHAKRRNAIGLGPILESPVARLPVGHGVELSLGKVLGLVE